MAIRLARFPLPAVDPRVLLEAELLRLGTSALPSVIMAGAGPERLVVASQEGTNAERRAVAAALFARPDVEWVGGYEARVLVRPGGTTLAAVAWLLQGENGWLSCWPALPGMPIEPDLAEVFEGPLVDLPAWVRASLELGEAPPELEFDELAGHLEGWPGDPRLPGPDATLPVGESPSADEVLALACTDLERRFAVEGHTDPVLVAWHTEGVALFWKVGSFGRDALQVLGRALARDERTLGLGLFGLGEDKDEGTPMIALVFEPREGSPAMWKRRFERTGDHEGRWLDPMGLLVRPVARMGWFGKPR